MNREKLRTNAMQNSRNRVSSTASMRSTIDSLVQQGRFHSAAPSRLGVAQVASGIQRLSRVIEALLPRRVFGTLLWWCTRPHPVRRFAVDFEEAVPAY